MGGEDEPLALEVLDPSLQEAAPTVGEATETDSALPRWRKTKISKLPDSFWEERRKLRNRNRSLRNKANKRRRNEQQRQVEASTLAALTQEEADALKEAAYRQRVKAHIEQQNRVTEGLKSGIRIVVECSFIEQFSDREVRSMGKQLEYSVVANKRSAKPAALTFCSWRGGIADFCKKIGSGNWPVNQQESSVCDSFPTNEIVMLSPDGEQVLKELDNSKVYCIGGIVDRTTKKNMSKDWAQLHGIPAYRLPINEYCPTQEKGKGHGKRTVLNINDVVTALLQFSDVGDWKQALEASLPERKKRDVTFAKHARRRLKSQSLQACTGNVGPGLSSTGSGTAADINPDRV